MKQTKVYFSLLALFLLMLSACTSAPKGCNIEGVVRDAAYEGRYVRLIDPMTSAVLDSTLIDGKKFKFNLGERTDAEVLMLELKMTDDDNFPSTLPVVTENGTLKVVMGAIVLTSGTPLNDAMQDFLLAVDNFSDTMLESGKEPAAIRQEFAKLLETNILMNKDNAVGVYIYRNYSSRLAPEQQTAIFEKAGEAFQQKVQQ